MTIILKKLEYDYLNMTIFSKTVKYDYLQYDYFFEKIVIFVQKNMTKKKNL